MLVTRKFEERLEKKRHDLIFGTGANERKKRAIAAVAEVSPAAVSKWGKDAGMIPARSLQKIFDGCRISNEEILDFFGR